MTEATKVAEKICENAPLAVRATKEAYLRGQRLPLAEGIRVAKLIWDRWTVARWPSLPLSGAGGPADGPASLRFGQRPDHDPPIPVITRPIFLITIDRSW